MRPGAVRPLDTPQTKRDIQVMPNGPRNRHGPARNVELRARFLEACHYYPNLSEVARALGMTRERARQVARELGLKVQTVIRFPRAAL